MSQLFLRFSFYCSTDVAEHSRSQRSRALRSSTVYMPVQWDSGLLKLWSVVITEWNRLPSRFLIPSLLRYSPRLMSPWWPYSVAPPFCSVRNVLQCFHIFVTMPLAASTYPAWKAVISLRVSSEYRPIGELYCFLWAGLTPTLPSAGLEAALQVDEQPFACTNWGFRGREQSMVGNAINDSADKIR